MQQRSERKENMMKTIDMHTHVVPPKFIEKIQQDERYGAKLVTNDAGKTHIAFSTGGKHPYKDVFFDMEARKKEMDKIGVDVHGLSISPRLFYYEFPLDIAKDVCMICNDSIHEMVQKDPDRFFPVGTVPLQDTDAAIEELKRIHEKYGFQSIQIGTEVNGKTIAEKSLWPFYEEVAKRNIKVIIHPFAYGEQKFMESYYLNNFIGNPLYSTLAAAHLIFSGLLEKYQNLMFVLCHGGGFLPYQIGRFDHGFLEREEPKENIQKLPSYYFSKNFCFDTICHDVSRTRALVDLVGEDVVLMGSDFPYDMADHDPYATVQALNIRKAAKEKIAFTNSVELFSLDRFKK